MPVGSSEFNCFGCAPENVKGLHLTFEERGQQVVTALCLGREYESLPGVIHGGIIALILDETMGRAAFSGQRRPALTVGLRVRYAQVMRTGESYYCGAEVSARDGCAVYVHGRLESKKDGLIAVADGTFFLLTGDRPITEYLHELDF